MANGPIYRRAIPTPERNDSRGENVYNLALVLCVFGIGSWCLESAHRGLTQKQSSRLASALDSRPSVYDNLPIELRIYNKDGDKAFSIEELYEFFKDHRVEKR